MTTSDRSAKPRSFAPKEHGAYVELGVPLAVALAAGRPSLASVGLTAAATAVFFAHEPLAILLGRRGKRARQENQTRAALRVAALSATVALSLVPVLAVMSSSLARSCVLPVVLLAATAGIIATRRERTTAGEAIVSTALASASIPVAVSGGIALERALSAWFAWSVGFIAATIAVRGVIAAKKHATPPSRSAAAVVALPILAGFGALLGFTQWWTVAATTPLVVVAAAVACKPPSPRALNRVGWVLVVATVATGAAIIVGMRA